MAQVPMRMPPANGSHILQTNPTPQHHIQQSSPSQQHHLPQNSPVQQHMQQNSPAQQHHIQPNSPAQQRHIQQGSPAAQQQHMQQSSQHLPQTPPHIHVHQNGVGQQHQLQQNGATHHLQTGSGAGHHMQHTNSGATHHLHTNTVAPPHLQPTGAIPTHHLPPNAGAATPHIIQQRPIPHPHQTVQGVGGHTHGNHPSTNHVMISQYGHPPSTSLPSVMVSGGHLPPPIQHIHTINNGSHATTLSHIGQVETAGYTRHPPQHHGVPPQFGRPPPVLVNRSQPELGSVKTKEKTPMCLVNELARFNKVQHQYKLTDELGPAHKKNFTVCLKIGDKEEYSASGPSIKKAQHAAAALSLEKTQFKHPTPKQKNCKSANVTPTVELNTLAMKRGDPTTYTFLEPNRSNQYSLNPGNRSGGFPPVFVVQLKVGNLEFIGEGPTAQAARHSAASQALHTIKEKTTPAPEAAKSKLDPTSTPFIPGAEYDDLKSPISLVHEIALKRNLTVAFSVVKESGPPHMRMFITRCTVGDMVCDGEGNGKKISKKRGAELMLQKLRALPPVASAVLPKPRKQTNTKKKSRNLIKVENQENTELKQSINPISRLIQIQQAKKEKEPVYTLIGERGMPRRREFFMKVTVGPNSAVGSGTNKKVAKRAAAEALLQMTGYTRPCAAPVKPALKSPGETSEKPKKITFVDEAEDVSTSGSSGRQLVPGILYIEDKNKKTDLPAASGSNLSDSADKTSSQVHAATIAKELLDGGTSPTADQIAKEVGSSLSSPLPQLPTSGQGVSSKEQLAYLSQILGFTVTYNDFPKKGEYLTLVSLSTNPSQVSHGSGQSLESSHNNAAHTALKTLAANGLDTITQPDNGFKSRAT